VLQSTFYNLKTIEIKYKMRKKNHAAVKIFQYAEAVPEVQKITLHAD
jgi:hypothetical protein